MKLMYIWIDEKKDQFWVCSAALVFIIILHA